MSVQVHVIALEKRRVMAVFKPFYVIHATAMYV